VAKLFNLNLDKNYHNVYKIDIVNKSMKKSIIFGLIALIWMISAVSAAAISINKTDLGSTVISELNNPAVFNFTFINFDESDNFEIYSFNKVSFSPKGTFEIPNGTSVLEVKAFPNEDIRKNLGFYKFEYELKGQTSGIFHDFLMIRIIELENALSVSAAPLLPSDSQIVIMLKNDENTHIEGLKVRLSSDFFEIEKEISFSPYEEINITIDFDKTKTARLFAGKYDVDAVLNPDGRKARITGVLDYLEENSISVDEKTEGFIARKTTITKTNKGNVAAKAQIEITKNIVSRLLTVYSIEPMSSKRSGLSVDYLWEKELNPSESYSILATTNYTIPLILIVLIVLVVVFAKVYSLQAINVEKRVSYVKTKGGQFALKVTLHVKANKHIDNIQIIDKLPDMTKLYEKYGRMPDKIDHATRRLFWNIPRLSAGEERVFSYIIYSGLNIVGRFELPNATAVFEHEGKQVEVWSNKAYFAVDTVIRKDF